MRMMLPEVRGRRRRMTTRSSISTTVFNNVVERHQWQYVMMTMNAYRFWLVGPQTLTPPTFPWTGFMRGGYIFLIHYCRDGINRDYLLPSWHEARLLIHHCHHGMMRGSLYLIHHCHHGMMRGYLFLFHHCHHGVRRGYLFLIHHGRIRHIVLFQNSPDTGMTGMCFLCF